MRLGTLGIFSKEIFDPQSAIYADQSHVYLTIAVDKTSEYRHKYPKISRTVFEVTWKLVEKNTDIVCVAMYLSQSIIPEEIVQQGVDFKVSSKNDNTYRYYKMLLSLDGHVSTVYLHEKCLSYFTWYHIEDTSSHAGDLLSLLPSQ